MNMWELMEDYLGERYAAGEDFTVHAVAQDWDIPSSRASRYILEYLRAQVRPNVPTQYVLQRVPGTRTSNAWWHVGMRASDARMLGAQLASDWACRVEGFTRPTMAQIAQLNPRAVPAARAVLKSVEASLEMLAAMTDPEA